jgi:hypothetical protein
MKRLLIVGPDEPSFPCVRWPTWETANAPDYQGLLLDCREPQALTNVTSISQIRSTMMNNNYTACVLLPEAKDVATFAGPIGLIPHYHLYLQQAAGQTLTVNYDLC